MSVKTNTFALARSPLVDKDGMLTWTGQQQFQLWNTQLTNALDQIGNFIGGLSSSVTITGRAGTLGTALQNIDSSGVITSGGIDFSRSYVNKNLDNISDGTTYKRTTANDVSGASAAYSALVASGPSSGKSLVFNGSAWVPQNVSYNNVSGTPASAGPTAHEWVSAYDASTATFTLSRPAFTDISGNLDVLQVASGTGMISFGTGAPLGSPLAGVGIYFDISVSPYQGYVYQGGAWHTFV